MTIDWKTLVKKTSGFTTSTQIKDPVSGDISVGFTGLYVTLSDLLKKQPASGYHSITIYADTLIIDVPSVKTAGLIVFARSVDVSKLKGKPLLIDCEAFGGGLLEFMVGMVQGGNLTIAPKAKPSAGEAVSTGMNPVQAVVYNVDLSGEKITKVPGNNTANIMGLITQAWTFGALESGFTAATYLAEENALSGSSEALSMLTWITTVLATFADGGKTMPSNYAAIYNQAASLATTLNVEPGAIYVPVLSGKIYAKDMNTMISLLAQYEGNIKYLGTRGSIKEVIETVSSGLAKSAAIEEGPLKVQIDNIKTNASSLASDIQSLKQNLFLQSQSVETTFQTLETYIALEKIKEELKAQIELALSLLKLAVSAAEIYEGDIKKLPEAVESAVNSIENGIEVIKGFIGSAAEDPEFSKTAIELLESQATLIQTFVNSATLWDQIEKGKSGHALPFNPAAVTVDLTQKWNNYLAQAEARVPSLREEAGDHKALADQLLAELKILAGYGIAIGGKFAAYIALLVRATEVESQIKASKALEDNWNKIASSAKSDEAKLAALKAVVQGRANMVRRSVYVAYRNYESAYYYLNFQAPPQKIEVDMTSKQMKAAQIGIQQWIEAALGEPGSDDHVRLPSDNTKVELDFEIVNGGKAVSEAPNVAVLSKGDNGDWNLLWHVPIGTEQLNGVLPNEGNVAIWISKAEFFLKGATPNSKGKIISAVSTTGTYENGFGPTKASTFATKGLTGNFLYDAANNQVYGPWEIKTAIFMTPTPYTQWSMTIPADGGDPSTATCLNMKLTIAYMVPN